MTATAAVTTPQLCPFGEAPELPQYPYFQIPQIDKQLVYSQLLDLKIHNQQFYTLFSFEIYIYGQLLYRLLLDLKVQKQVFHSLLLDFHVHNKLFHSLLLASRSISSASAAAYF